MSRIINLNSHQISTLSRILSRYLSRSQQGKKIIDQFQTGTKNGRQELLAYLDRHLREDERLQQQVKDILNQQQQTVFMTTIAGGGQVDEIFNIGQLDHLNIHYSLFSDTRQVVIFFVGLLIIGGALAGFIWRWNQPERMPSEDFNIAVATFNEPGTSLLGRLWGDAVAPKVSQRLFSNLQNELHSLENVNVIHENIRPINSLSEAETIAAKTNADLVIYGDAIVVDGFVRLTPHFFVADSYEPNLSEVIGEHKLTPPTSFPVAGIIRTDNSSLDEVEERTSILVNFTKALVYLQEGKLNSSLIAINETITEAEIATREYGSFRGVEVIYLFASEINRLLYKRGASTT